MPWQSVAGKCALGGSSAHIGRKAVRRGPQAVSRASACSDGATQHDVSRDREAQRTTLRQTRLAVV